jgi:hypothetical protein
VLGCKRLLGRTLQSEPRPTAQRGVDIGEGDFLAGGVDCPGRVGFRRQSFSLAKLENR